MSITGVNMDTAPAVTQRLSNTTQTLSSAFDDLQQFLEARFGCWGDDETGKSFAKNYVPNYQSFMDNFKTLRDSLVQNAGDIAQIPEEFANLDQQNAQAVSGQDY